MFQDRVAAFVEYRQAAEAVDLWWKEGMAWDADMALRRMKLQIDFANKYPDFEFMWFERAETQFHVGELTSEIIDNHGGQEDLTHMEVMRAFHSRPAHERDLPSLATAIVVEYCLPRDEARDLLASAWMGTEFPEHNAGTEEWVQAFEWAGWISDVENDDGIADEPRPNEPLLLYRGAIEERAEGMAWTDRLDTALWFAQRFGDTPVWCVSAPPAALLAHFVQRNEYEYVIDPDGLDITMWNGTVAEPEQRSATALPPVAERNSP